MRILLLFLFLFAWSIDQSPAAALAEPDSLLYGSVNLHGKPATNSNVRVEARRGLLGQPLASFAMGSTNEARNYFVLPILRNTEPEPMSDFFKSGDNLVVVLISDGVIIENRAVTLGAAGDSIRIDFGEDLDQNQNSLPDRWEDLYPAGDLNSDLDSDGLSKFAEFLAGTNPNNSQDVFALNVERNSSNAVVQVSFTPIPAQGIGYVNRQRLYGLERATNLAAPTWEVVPGFSALPAASDLVLYSEESETNAPAYFRAIVRLSP